MRTGDAAGLTEAEVTEFAASCLARYKAPSQVNFVDELPHGVAGKLLRRQLRGAISGGPGAVGVVATRNPANSTTIPATRVMEKPVISSATELSSPLVDKMAVPAAISALAATMRPVR